MNQRRYGNLIKLTRLGMFNCYFVREDDGYTLIDTNLPGSADAIIKAAGDLPIKRIVLTHAHNDHVASLDALHEKLPEAAVYASERTVPFLRGDVALQAGEPGDKLRGGYTTVQTRPTHTVNEGDCIGSLRVIAAPGHTPGQIALLDTRDNTLIAADAFQTQAQVAVAGKMVWLFPFPAMATWHKPTAIETARKLADFHPARLAVGHGPVLENPAAKMQKAIQVAEKSL